MKLRKLSLLFLLLLTSCSGFAYERTLVGRYHLLAIDTVSQMSLCWSVSGGGCVSDGLPEDTVVAAGYNDQYVVAALDVGSGPPASKNATRFYYVVRAFEDQNKDTGLPYKGIRGPLTRDEYANVKSRLHLPEFSWHYEDL